MGFGVVGEEDLTVECMCMRSYQVSCVCVTPQDLTKVQYIFNNYHNVLVVVMRQSSLGNPTPVAMHSWSEPVLKVGGLQVLQSRLFYEFKVNTADGGDTVDIAWSFKVRHTCTGM